MACNLPQTIPGMVLKSEERFPAGRPRIFRWKWRNRGSDGEFCSSALLNSEANFPDRSHLLLIRRWSLHGGNLRVKCGQVAPPEETLRGAPAKETSELRAVRPFRCKSGGFLWRCKHPKVVKSWFYWGVLLPGGIEVSEASFLMEDTLISIKLMK